MRSDDTKACAGCRRDYGAHDLPHPDTFKRSKFCGEACFRAHRRTSRVVRLATHAEVHCAGGAVFLVSLEDVSLIEGRSWCIDSGGYAAGRGERVHRLIARETGGAQVDHVNRNKLDNRRDNLRLTDGTINNLNREGANRNSLTGVRGVTFDKHRCQYQSRIRIRGRCHFLGRFDSLEAAAEARAEAEREFWSAQQ